MVGWKQSLLSGAAAAALFASPVASHAADGNSGSWLDSWTLEGYNTARADHYDIDGNALASPFAFDDWHGYDEFGLTATRQFSPYERFRMSVNGVINGSDYRNVDEGLVPERINFLYENGEGSLPYRIEVGDYLAGISYRTLQRTLKGAAVEVQPFDDGGNKHSILLFSGTHQPTYRSFDIDDEFYTGASWLMETRDGTRASLNVVHGYQDETTATLAGTDNSQMLYSVAVETPFDFASQSLNLEGEFSFFDGDYAAMKDQRDTGAFAQLTGRSQQVPLDYRFRFERYGTDYRPNGAIITPDRMSYEGHAGWRFDDGLYLRGRAQRFNDSFDSTNTLKTDVFGLNLSGPMLGSVVEGVTGNIDVFTQRLDDDFNTVDRDADTLNASLNMPIYRDWNGQFSLFVSDVDDNLASNADSLTRQAGFGVFIPVTVGEMTGTVNPGFVIRDLEFTSTGGDSVELNPTLNVNLSNEQHRISANYGILNQNRIVSRAGLASGPDLATTTAGLEYAYTTGIHELGLSGSYYDRDIDLALNTDVWRAGAYWTVRFNKPAGSSARNSATRTAAASSGSQLKAPEMHYANLSLIQEISPGESLKRATALLKEEGLTSPVSRSGVKSYEAQLLASVIERQRIVLEHRKGKIKKSGLVVDVTDTGSPRSVEQLYARIKQDLVKNFGSPDNEFEQGDFGSNIVSDINTDRVIRVTEWNTDNGVMRLGIPRRLDGQVRIELQHAESFKSPRDTLWSMKLY